MAHASEKPARRGPRALSLVVKDLMGPKALGRRRRVSRELTQAWIEVAGTEIANQTRVRGLRRGVLTIEVESSPLCHQLASFQRDDLLLALQARVRRADLMEIRFRAGPLA